MVVFGSFESFDEYNYIFFKYLNGSINLTEIEITCKLQIICFGITYIWGVPRDPTHKYFVILDDRIKQKLLLPFKDYIINNELQLIFITKYIFGFISICGFLFFLLYVFSTFIYGVILREHNYNKYYQIQLVLFVFEILFAILFCIFVIFLIFKHFEFKRMIIELILQFRCNILLIAICILCYTGIQKLIISNNTSFIVDILLNHIVFSITIFLILVRDGMNITYPYYFVISTSIILLIISIYNVFLLTFVVSSNKYYFILAEKEAYYQVIVIAILTLYHCYYDKDSKYFVLIRKRKKTKQLWSDYDDNNNDVMNEILLNNYNINDSL